MSGMDRLTDERLDAWSKLLEWDDKHSAGDSFDSDETHELLLMARELLVLRRASQAAPAPSDRLVSVGKASGLVEARASLAARQIRQTMRDYGHSCAETSLPELIASDVDAALRKQEEIHAPAPSDGLREAVRAALEGELSFGAYDCTRVWEAWSVGTMTQDDFVPVSERLDEITDAVLAALTPTPAQEGEPRHD